MTEKRYHSVLFFITLGGVLFSGYLSATKLFIGTCAFDEACPYFLGYPACVYGFGMFLSMFVITAVALFSSSVRVWSTKAIVAISVLGTVFSGSFVVREIIGWVRNGGMDGYALGLPTCVYGLVFYILILVLSLWQLRKR